MIDLIRKLHPKGRAYNIEPSTFFYSLMKGLSLSDDRFNNSALSLQDKFIPDNNNWTAEDCDLWEARLNIPVSIYASIEDRKKAISRKYGYPNNVYARQSLNYINDQLNLSGFASLSAYENKDVNGDTIEIVQGTQQDTECGDVTECADTTVCGGGSGVGLNVAGVVINSLYNVNEVITGMTARSFQDTFIIASKENLYTAGQVDKYRETELRNLLLLIKPLGSFAYLNVNYITQ